MEQIAVPSKVLMPSLSRHFHITRWRKSVVAVQRTAAAKSVLDNQLPNMTSISRYGGNAKRQSLSTALRLFCDADRSQNSQQHGVAQLANISVSDIFYGDSETDFEFLALYLNGCALLGFRMVPDIVQQLHGCSLEDASLDALDSILAALTFMMQHQAYHEVDVAWLVCFCERVTPVMISSGDGPLVGRLLLLSLAVNAGSTVAFPSQLENLAFLCSMTPVMSRSLFFVFFSTINVLRGYEAAGAVLRLNHAPLVGGASRWIDGASPDEIVLLWRVVLWLCAAEDQNDTLDLIAHELVVQGDLCDDAHAAMLLHEHQTCAGVACNRFKKLPASWRARLQQLDDAGWKRVAAAGPFTGLSKTNALDAVRRDCQAFP